MQVRSTTTLLDRFRKEYGRDPFGDELWAYGTSPQAQQEFPTRETEIEEPKAEGFLPEELIKVIENVYPDIIQPAIDYGYEAREIPNIGWRAATTFAQEDWQGFVNDLVERKASYQDIGTILTNLGVQPGAIQQFVEQLGEYRAATTKQEDIEKTLKDVFPSLGLEDVAGFAEENYDEFVNQIRLKGRSLETEALLNAIGITPQQLGEFFGEPEEFPRTQDITKFTSDYYKQRGWMPVHRGIATPEQIRDDDRRINEAREAYQKLTGKTFADIGKENVAITLEKARDTARALLPLPREITVAVLQAVGGTQERGTGASVVNKDWADKFIESAEKDAEKFARELAKRYGDETGMLIKMSDIATISKNIAYSLTSMGAGVAVGAPIALIPLPFARTAAWLVGTAASGAVAYSMTKYQIMQEYLELKDAEKRAETGKGLTLEEENQLKKDFEPKAHAYGLWEAVPEAISNLLFLKILGAPFTKVVGKVLAGQILMKIAEMYGEEMLTETITQMGQSKIEVEAGLREGRIGWVDAFKEIAPQTFLLTTIMGGAGQVGISAYSKIKQSLIREVGSESPLVKTFGENITDVLTGKVVPFVKAELRGLATEEAGFAFGEKPEGEPTPEAVTPEVAIPKELSPFVDEARKYKTFEEFERALFSEEWQNKWRYKEGLLGDIATMGFPKATEQVTGGRYIVSGRKGLRDFWESAMAIPKAIPVTPEVTIPTPENLKIGQTLIDGAGDRWTVTNITKDGRYTIKAEAYRGLTRTTQIRELERFFTIEQPSAIPKAEPVTPTAPEVVIPEAQEGMPEAGLQTDIFGNLIPVEPTGRGRVTQISMEDQLKLEKARREAEGVKPSEEIEIGEPTPEEELITPEQEREQAEYQGRVEAGALAEELANDPVAQYRFQMGTRIVGKGETRKVIPNMVGLESLISIREQSFPESLTVKQAQALNPDRSFSEYSRKGEPQYNKVPREVALDELADKFKVTPYELGKKIERLRETRRRIRELGGRVISQRLPARKPALPKSTPEEITEATQAGAKLTQKQTDYLLKLFDDYLTNPNIEQRRQLALDLRRGELAKRLHLLQNREEQLVIEGKDYKDAHLQARAEAMSGVLPNVTTDYFSDMTIEMENVLFSLVYHKLKNEPTERMATVTALTHALAGESIPSKPGGMRAEPFPEGGSALLRLRRVFSSHPQVLKLVEGMAEAKTPLRDVVEGIFRETPGVYAPIDEEMAEYLRKVPDFPYMQKFELPEGYTSPVMKWGTPIDEVVKTPSMIPLYQQNNIIRALKEAGLTAEDIGNLMRATKSTFDQSWLRTVGRMVPYLIVTEPKFVWSVVVEGWKTTFSEKTAEAAWTRITQSPLYGIYQRGRDFLRPKHLPKGTVAWRGVEEFGFNEGQRPIQRLTQNAFWIKPFQRSFVTACNMVLWHSYENFYKLQTRKAERIASGEAKLEPNEDFSITNSMIDFSKMLGDFGGRGELGPAAPMARGLSAFFFAARNKVAKFMSWRHLISSNKDVRAQAWKTTLTWYGMIGGLLLLGRLLNLWDVEDDPRSADFMKIRIGNIRIDPWGGYQQAAVFVSRLISGTGISSITGAKYETDPQRAVQTFIEGAQAPLASIIMDFWTGDTFLGEKVDIKNPKQWAERLVPFAVWDIYEAVKENAWVGIAAAPAIFYGTGGQTYTGDWKENALKLGLHKYSDNLNYGITEPVYDFGDFWADTASQFEGVDPASLTVERGYDPKVRIVVEGKLILDNLELMPNVKLIAINADPTKNNGVTFHDYYKQWQKRLTIEESGDEEALKKYDTDERTRNANLGNMTQAEYALLVQYHGITDKKKQKKFLEAHPELDVNPREEYLRAHPKENAILAIGGKADVYTQEAYDEAQKLVKQLGLPENAFKDFLPEKDVAKDLFSYNEVLSKFGANAPETKLIVAKNDKLRIFLDRSIVDTPIKSLEIKVKNRKLSDEYDGYSDEKSPFYVADEKKRKQAYKDFRVKNPTYVDDLNRIEAYEHEADENTVKLWVEHGRVAGKAEGYNVEEKLWLYDNPVVHKWALEQGLITDTGKDWNVPSMRITAKYREEDAGYDALPTTGTARTDYLRANDGYRMDRRRRDAYQLTNSKTGQKFPTNQIENYVKYYELEARGYRRERMLVANPRFAKAMHDIAGIDLPDPKKIPPARYDDLYDMFKDEFDRLAGLSNHESPYYIENPAVRRRVADRMRRDARGNLTPFGKAEKERNKILKKVSGKTLISQPTVGLSKLEEQGLLERYLQKYK